MSKCVLCNHVGVSQMIVRQLVDTLVAQGPPVSVYGELGQPELILNHGDDTIGTALVTPCHQPADEHRRATSRSRAGAAR